MGQSNFPSGLETIAGSINKNPKLTALAVIFGSLLFVAIKSEDTRKWLFDVNPVSTEDSASVKIEDEIATSNTTLLTTPY